MPTASRCLSSDLKQLRSHQKLSIHHTFFVHFASIAFNDRELVWEWWVRKRCVNDWYIVAEVLEYSIRKRGTFF